MFEFLCCNCNRYEKYSQKKGWKFDIVDIMESDLKGYKVCPYLASNLSAFFEILINCIPVVAAL